MEGKKSQNKKGRERTLKIVEEKRMKDEFFEELAQEVENKFSSD